MKPLAVFYHCRLSGGQHCQINQDFAISIMVSQMIALDNSGLLKAANIMVVGSNGSRENAGLAKVLAPAKATIVDHGPNVQSELPTIALVRQFAIEHPGWFILYHHIKGVTHPQDPLWFEWRRCMEKCCVWHWQRCVADMEAGFASVGAHWLTPEQYPQHVTSPFWGGTFWWAKSDFLQSLPELPKTAANRDQFYLAEKWIGMGPRPLVRDYAPHWPGHQPCSRT